MEENDKKLQAKKAEIQKKLAECDELKLDLQRTRADFENYRKNTENRISSAHKLGEKKAILQLLPIVLGFITLIYKIFIGKFRFVQCQFGNLLL